MNVPLNVFQDVTTDNFNFKLPRNFSSYSSNKRKEKRQNGMLKRKKTTKQENFLNFISLEKNEKRMS